ncbi:FAD-dependent oxidoreductase [Roseateles sp.]|uniref:FAD-dependent oxidoreductase n=1 Tax=Roseateles sp. TaxID=1971397 RepID=UPI00286AC10F|nr:FAD-dependent oxidoreductase [Roseateles sp.]
MRRLVLAGAGHAHAQVLLAWAQSPPPDVELVLVSPHALAPYSGMVPGWLAGTYAFDEIVIDFPRLCHAAGARWIASSIARLDPDARTLQLDNGESLSYDWLSLNIGSTLTPPPGEFASRFLSMRPLANLHTDYDQLLDDWCGDRSNRPFRVTAVGGGAAGFESVLAVLRRLRTLRPERRVEGCLMARSTELLPGYPRAARRKALQALRDADVRLQLGADWCDSVGHSSDLVLWATGAQAHAWQRRPELRGNLAVSGEGYVLIDANLRSLSHPNIFASGDCAQWRTPLPKAGVYAVRMGPVLTHNLGAVMNAALSGSAPQAYRPQRVFLSLLATADGSAIASRGTFFSLSGRWAWRLKEHIDRGFVKRFAPAASHPTLDHSA